MSVCDAINSRGCRRGEEAQVDRAGLAAGWPSMTNFLCQSSVQLSEAFVNPGAAC